MNQPNKTVLPDEIITLLREAEGVLNQPLIDNIKVLYTGNDGILDPVARSVIEHITCLRSTHNAIEKLLETPELKRFAGGVLHGELHLCISLKMLAGAINDLEVINAAKKLDDIISYLQEAI